MIAEMLIARSKNPARLSRVVLFNDLVRQLKRLSSVACQIKKVHREMYQVRHHRLIKMVITIGGGGIILRYGWSGEKGQEFISDDADALVNKIVEILSEYF